MKNPILIGELLSIAWSEAKRPGILTDLVSHLKAFSANSSEAV
jgi:hypothetical protein